MFLNDQDASGMCLDQNAAEDGITKFKSKWHLKWNNFHSFFRFFSSPELKAQVSFSDHLSSVVCPSVCLSVCLSICKLFTFSTSSPEPLGQFQPNLAQSILWREGFNFLQMKGPRPFPRGDNYEIRKIHWWNLKKSSSPEPLSKFQPILAQASLDDRDSSFFKWRTNKFSLA